MKRIFSLLLCVTLLLSGCSLFCTDTEEVYVCKQIGVDFNEDNSVLISTTDTHGGFLGDGEYFVVYSFADDFVENQIIQNDKWSSELTENLCGILYGSEYWSEKVIYEDYCRIYPVIENGYYFFYDRHTDAKDPYEDSEVHNRCSYNYTAAAYDCDADILYFIKVDT